jgi:tetratricopeptide (TPR) repeat protein
MVIASEWIMHAPKPRALSGTDRWNVFLSYRSVNRAWVLNLYDVLREMGHKVFLDQTALKPGDQLIRELQDALKNSQAGILIWSSATQDSEWVQREYQTLERLAAERKDFQFVPVRLDRSKLPLFAEARIFLDFADYPDGPNGGELLRLLHSIAGVPLSDEAARFAAAQDDAAQQAANKIAGAVEIGNEKQLMDLFEKDGLPWRVSTALGCKAAEGLTKLGRNDEALKVLEQLEAQFPKAIRPKQLRALALARRAAKTKCAEDLDEAQAILAELYAAGERDPETLGIYGRTWMDRYQLDRNMTSLRKSRDLYAEAFDGARDDYYTGINAAAKSVLLGTPDDLEKANEYATRVLDIVGTEAWPGDYWKTATAAEALLMQKNYGQAADLYQKAIAISPMETGSHGASWTQASRLMAKLRASAGEQALIKQAFGGVAEG